LRNQGVVAFLAARCGGRSPKCTANAQRAPFSNTLVRGGPMSSRSKSSIEEPSRRGPSGLEQPLPRGACPQVVDQGRPERGPTLKGTTQSVMSFLSPVSRVIRTRPKSWRFPARIRKSLMLRRGYHPHLRL